MIRDGGRERILGRIRAALRAASPAGHPTGAPLPAAEAPKPPESPGREVLVARFLAEAKAVDAEVHRGRSSEVLERLFGPDLVRRAATPDRPAPRDGNPIELAVTRAAWGMSDSGTIVEYHARGSESAISALAETHAAILSETRILPDVAAFYREFARDLERIDPPLYAVLVTGPSRTADVEQTLVLGAHGPRRLVVVLEP